MKSALQKKKTKVGLIFIIVMTFVVCGCCFGNGINVYAQDAETNIDGKYYEFDKKSDYEFSEAESFKSTADIQTYGTFSLSGNLVNSNDSSGIKSFGVDGGNVSFIYKYDDVLLKAKEDEWHIIDDKGKKVDSQKLDEKIMKGVMILQTSKDGKKWIDNEIVTNLFGKTATQNEEFYTTTDVQLSSGCYYRIIYAYELSIKTESSKILFIENDKYDYKKCLELYEFYLYDNKTDGIDASNELKTNLGSKVNTGKDGNGYSGNETIDDEDPHYGWDLGNFFVSGYTQKTEDGNGNFVFLKNVGDKVTLWFNLKQDIDYLNGNEKLSISRDKDGFDQYFETDKTDFGRGTLIVRYTDYEGVSHEPQIYTNYLEANLSPGADTVVQLFEEGDYEVALDYEIQNDKRVVLGQSVFPEYTHYRIFFEFSVRNGNCMVYAFDNATGAELPNGAIAKNGFTLDLANSLYLDINIKKEILTEGVEGLVEDTRFNRPAKDGDSYIDEGIYTFTVSNKSTNQETTKKIYVGDNNILKAYMATGLPIREIQEKIEQGAVVQADGTIVELDVDNNESKPDEPEPTDKPDENDEKPIKENNNGIMVICVVCALVVAVILTIISKRKIKNVEEEVK